MNRRKFLAGASLLALISSSPSLARFPRGSAGTPSGFNGGITQGQSALPSTQTDYPFLNYFKASAQSWSGTDSFNVNQPINPSWLASDGYPNLAVVNANSTSGSGVFMSANIPPQASYTGGAGGNGNLVLRWIVTGAGGSDTVNWGIGLQATTPVSGSLTSTGNGTFVYKFTPSYNTGTGFNFNILGSTGAATHVSNVSLTFDGADDALYLAGKFFNTAFLTKIGKGGLGYGVFRFMDWLGTGISNTTFWSTRKSIGYPTWSGDEYRANLSAGVTSSNVGNDYTIASMPGTYVWPGFTAGSAPVDKQTMHIRFNVDSSFINNTQQNNLTITGISPLTLNWPSNPLSNGDPVNLGANNGNQPTGTSGNIPYYVVQRGVGGTDRFQLSLTPGGSSVSASDVGQGSSFVTRLSTLKIDGVNAIPIVGPLTQPMNTNQTIPVSTILGGSAQTWGTITYESSLGCWMLCGATNNSSNFGAGLVNYVPIEVCFELCKELGAHPHWSLPPLALDPQTDYVTSLATYCQTNNPGWMIPHFEPGNEVWNTVSRITQYSQGKTFAYWGTAGSLHDWYGMILSMTGQAIATVYGSGNLGTTYEVMCGVKTPDGRNPTGGGQDPRLGASQWTVQNSPARSGFTIQQAKLTTSAVLVATYVSPSMQGTAIDELQNAWQYYFVNGANPANPAAMTNLNNYVDTLDGAASPDAFPNNTTALIFYRGFNAWGATFSVNKMFAYEGGYSPSLIVSGNDWNSNISAATNATQCVLTLPTSNGGDPEASSNGVSGNPAIVGMCLQVGGINTGMTQLNTPSSAAGNGNITFTIGTSVVTFNNTFVANMGIVFAGNAYGNATSLPTNINTNQTYFILSAGLSSTQFQISATKGGSPISFTAPSGVTTVSAASGWAAGWVVTAVSGTSVTVDCNSVSFGTFTTSGNFPQVNYLGSMSCVNNFRVQTLQYATDLAAKLKNNYDNYTKAYALGGGGGLFPSQYQNFNTGSIWAVGITDVFTTTPSQQFNMISAYN